MSGRWFLIAGIALGLLGPILNLAQMFWARQVSFVPWYLPILGTIAVALLIDSALDRPNVWRIGFAVVFGLLAVGEWYVLLFFTRVPSYHGPLASGQPLPAFTTTLADGSQLSNDDLTGRNTVLVFFRGRW